MTNLINSELSFSNTDSIFNCIEDCNYNIQINDNGNIIIKIKKTYHSQSHPPTVIEEVINIEDNIPLPSHILNICKIIFDGINKNTQEVSLDIIKWLKEIKNAQLEKVEYAKLRFENSKLIVNNVRLKEEINYTKKARKKALKKNKKMQDKINIIQNDIAEKTLQNTNMNQKLEELCNYGIVGTPSISTPVYYDNPENLLDCCREVNG